MSIVLLHVPDLAMWPLQGGSLSHSINLGSTQVTLSSRIFRNLRTLVRLPGHIFNLITFKAQQIMLGGTMTKLVGYPFSGHCSCAAYFKYTIKNCRGCVPVHFAGSYVRSHHLQDAANHASRHHD